tara:strand:+ start:345 stop:509 length:165 start_codon:yes stop_codon:yes gene_type:complete
MMQFLFAIAALTCVEAQELIDSVNQSRLDEKADIIKVIKMNTQDECHERSKRNS